MATLVELGSDGERLGIDFLGPLALRRRPL